MFGIAFQLAIHLRGSMLQRRLLPVPVYDYGKWFCLVPLKFRNIGATEVLKLLLFARLLPNCSAVAKSQHVTFAQYSYLTRIYWFINMEKQVMLF